MKNAKRFLIIALALVLALTAACGKSAVPAVTDSEPEQAEKNGDVVILHTGDVHCGVDKGFGYAGVEQMRRSYEEQGYTVLLVDTGDAIQGETIGTLTKGEAIIGLMNSLDYDLAVPGNHEFDFGADYFVELTGKADFPYISCNFTKNGELVYEPYKIIEAADMKIAFVGVCSPETIITSTPSYFQDENGEFVYDFMYGKTHEKLYDAVQSAADSARAQGADYVVLLSHIGMKASASVTYADVIANTSGIDLVLDGHSHDTDIVVMKNKDGKEVERSAAGSKLNCVGCTVISAEEGIGETQMLSWPNSACAADVFGIENEVGKKVKETMTQLGEELGRVTAHTAYALTINDPEAKDNAGEPIRMVRRAETNLGDLCADALRVRTGADIGLVNGGGVRTSIEKGDITYNDIISVFPFSNQVYVIEATGSQIADALEWGAKNVPDESGCFLQVSGLEYEIDVSVPSSCVSDDEGFMSGVEGARRVKNITVGGEPIDPDKLYTVAGTNYVLLEHGDGLTAFDGAKPVKERVNVDSQVLLEYISQDLGGEIGSDYADPGGQGRITVTGQ